MIVCICLSNFSFFVKRKCGQTKKKKKGETKKQLGENQRQEKESKAAGKRLV